MAISIYVYESSAAPAPVAFMSTFFEHHKFAVNTDKPKGVLFNVQLDALTDYDRDTMLSALKLKLPVYIIDPRFSIEYTEKLLRLCNAESEDGKYLYHNFEEFKKAL